MFRKWHPTTEATPSRLGAEPAPATKAAACRLGAEATKATKATPRRRRGRLLRNAKAAPPVGREWLRRAVQTAAPTGPCRVPRPSLPINKLCHSPSPYLRRTLPPTLNAVSLAVSLAVVGICDRKSAPLAKALLLGNPKGGGALEYACRQITCMTHPVGWTVFAVRWSGGEGGAGGAGGICGGCGGECGVCVCVLCVL
jgi:hypothetical protein